MVMAATAAAAADEESICAERPGKANPTCTVPPGMVQVEASFIEWAHLEYRLTAEDAPVKAAVYPFVKISTAKRSVALRRETR